MKSYASKFKRATTVIDTIENKKFELKLKFLGVRASHAACHAKWALVSRYLCGRSNPIRTCNQTMP